ncbi:MAG: isoprenylcysteine carboxylmethyltransferase family protein [Deltaproteobacteria bacterium]|nr:isoprenylcysteine carboxylmethyltransferase family protein [Deltaproteobacteria bacterium]MBW2396144.1 isoprenylcysteine carboxylmethyltransferase family protein [Deltaproteobacteria bacterium]
MADVETRTDSRALNSTAFVKLALAAVVIVSVGLIYLMAPRFEWTLGWIYVGIVVVTYATNLACVLRWNSVLIRRRARLGKGTKAWDAVWLLLFGPAVIAVYVVAVQDLRSEGSNAPGAAWLLGLALFVPGWALAIWSMVVNPFFEKTVRIQTDQGHHVIDTGPYAYVRHPGYVGFVAWMVSTPLMLGSTSAWVPALLAVLLLVIRTVLEDRTLRAELPGYAEYAARVRFRLIPRVW